MLVVTANWSWTDGSLAPAPPGRGSGWLQHVHRGVLRACCGRDGRYRPAETVDIVFAGDTFDCLVSRGWTAGVRPWHGGPQVAAVKARVLAEAARRGRRLLAGLARWARGGMSLPAADRRGRPAARGTTRATVRVTLLAGDRDPWLEQAAGIAARHHCQVGRIWADDESVVRHGAEFDPCWSGGELPLTDGAERPPFLGESVLVDLVARFASAILGDGQPVRPLRRLVGRLTAATPLDMPAQVAAWLATGHEGAELPTSRRLRIETEWRAAVGAWHRAASREPPVCGIEACPIDWLAGWLEHPRATLPPADVWPRFVARPPRGPGASGLVLGHVGGDDPAGAADGVPGQGPMCLGTRTAVACDPPTAVRTSRGWAWLAAASPPAGIRRTPSTADATMTADGIVVVPPTVSAPQATRPAAWPIDLEAESNAAA
jgi:hypothetical protein